MRSPSLRFGVLNFTRGQRSSSGVTRNFTILMLLEPLIFDIGSRELAQNVSIEFLKQGGSIRVGTFV